MILPMGQPAIQDVQGTTIFIILLLKTLPVPLLLVFFCLEAISKRPQCNEGCKQDERKLGRPEFLFPNQQPVFASLAAIKSWLNLPSAPVRPQFATILIFLGLPTDHNSMPPFNRLWPSGSLSYPLSVMMRTGFCRGRPPPCLGTAIFSRVGCSRFISLAEAESGAAPIGAAWPSTTTIHPCRLCSFQRIDPFLPRPNCHRPRFLPNLTDPVAPVRTGT